jgi:hypothetical protein
MQPESNGQNTPDMGESSQKRIKEHVLLELREIQQMVKEKIDKIEKEIHPI